MEKPPEIHLSGVNWILPIVAKIQGIALLPAGPASLAEVAIQYGSSQTQRWCEVRMPLDQALFLSGLLEQMRNDPRVVAALGKNP